MPSDSADRRAMRQLRRWRALALLLSLVATVGALARWWWGMDPTVSPALHREPAPAVMADGGARLPGDPVLARRDHAPDALRSRSGRVGVGLMLMHWLGLGLGVALLPVTPAQASPICQWVDAQGRTQMARVVPERYKKSARCIDAQTHELPEAEREVAQQRRAAERAQVQREALPSQPAPVLPLLPGPRSPDAVAPAVTKRPAEVVTDATDCPTWRRLFQESENCFAPFRTTRGGIKSEGFDVCAVVPSPEPQCGPLID